MIPDLPAGARFGDTILVRKPPRFERNYSKFFRVEFGEEEMVPFIVGVTEPEEFERQLRKRTYRPMIQTRGFDPARLPK